MNILFIVLFIILILIVIALVINLSIEVIINPFKLSIKLFNIEIYKKKNQDLYNLMVKNVEEMEEKKTDKELVKNVLKAIKIRVIEFSNNVEKSSPINVLTIGFLNIIMPILNNVSFKDALLVKYEKSNMIELKVLFKLRIIELIYRVLKYKIGKLYGKKA